MRKAGLRFPSTTFLLKLGFIFKIYLSSPRRIYRRRSNRAWFAMERR